MMRFGREAGSVTALGAAHGIKERMGAYGRSALLLVRSLGRTVRQGRTGRYLLFAEGREEAEHGVGVYVGD